ncbi:hypothetical protein BGZ83_008356 [Gryganskiella cystojenkinii]|nr:hypothetical protein BGZ83_008356 [Gryganskiella cystojenkinii]
MDEQANSMDEEDVPVVMNMNKHPGAVSEETPPKRFMSSGANKLKQKRARITTERSNASLRRPFRSPLMVSKASAEASATGGATKVTYGSNITQGVSSNNMFASPLALKPKAALTTDRQTNALGSATTAIGSTGPKPVSTSSKSFSTVATKKPCHKRALFRSPVIGGSTTSSSSPHPSSSSSTVASQLIERQALERRITELQSNIRKGQLVVRSQESEDVPLEDLIEKWKRASQTAAEVLLQKYIEQEQIFGGANRDDSDLWGNNGHNSNSYYNNASLSSSQGPMGGFATASGWNGDGSSGGYGDGSEPGECRGYADTSSAFTGEDKDHGRDRWRAEEERMEVEDIQNDLPTVEEALRSRCFSAAGQDPRVHKTLTKMQKLLCALGVDFVTIGYDPETDSFSV